MDNNWKQDPRLKAMDPEKVTLLTGFAEKISHTDQSHFMNSFLQVCQEANTKGLHFTDSETALLVDILSCHMPEKDRKKLQFFKVSSRKDCRRNLQINHFSSLLYLFLYFFIIAFSFYMCYILPMRHKP